MEKTRQEIQELQDQIGPAAAIALCAWRPGFVTESWAIDRGLIENHGCAVVPLREREGLVEAVVRRGAESLTLQWTRNSAVQFFPLVEHEDFGLALHSFDLATNKVLAMVGRLEVRDWVDVITSHERIQPLGFLA